MIEPLNNGIDAILQSSRLTHFNGRGDDLYAHGAWIWAFERVTNNNGNSAFGHEAAGRI